MRIFISVIIIFLIHQTIYAQTNTRTVWLDELDISKVTQDRSEPKRNQNTEGNPIAMGGKVYERGLGTHASSTFYIQLNGGTRKFSAVVGLDDAVRHLEGSPQEFMVIGDDKILWRSGLMGQVDYPKTCEVDLSGVDVLLLMVRHGKGKFRGVVNWADAKFEVTGDQPEAFIPRGKEPYLLTPQAGDKPKINGPLVFGVRPAAPFFYKIPATGKAPLTYQADDLPEGLQVNENNGVISGTIT
jgi:alpha-galactosidase